MKILRRRRIRHLVRELYKCFLGREPDPEGARNYEDLLLRVGPEAGLPKILKSFQRSKEYEQRTGKIAASHINASLASQSRQLINGRPVNHLVSLGSFCLPSMICQANGLRTYSLPFDWIFSTPRMVRECLNDDFAVFLDQRYYRSVTQTTEDDAKSERAAEHEFYREKYGLGGMFAHKDPTREPDYLYYIRCVNRLRQILSSGDTKLFWIISRAHHDLTKEFPLLLESLELRTTNFALLGIELMDPVESGSSTMVPVMKTGNHALYRFTPSSYDARGGFLPEKLDEWAVLRLVYRYKLDLKETPWTEEQWPDAGQPDFEAYDTSEEPEQASLSTILQSRVEHVGPTDRQQRPAIATHTAPISNHIPREGETPPRLNVQPADAETIDLLFQTILGRPVGNAQFKKDHNNAHSIHHWIQRLVESEEFKDRFLAKNHAEVRNENYIADIDYRTPTLGPVVKPSLVLVTGSCMTNPWRETIERAHPGIEVRHQEFNNASELEDIPEQELRRANFQIVQLPLRSVIAEVDYFTPDLSDKGLAALEQGFQRNLAKLRRNLDAALKYNRAVGVPVFVLNFAIPQANPLGFLLPKHDLFNFSHYLKELNRALYEMISAEKSVYMIDYDEITATLGKRFIQDDLTSHISHGSTIMGTQTEDDILLTPHGSMSEIYAAKNTDMTLAVFNECVAYYNIISSDDKVKLVIFDLDGTLWRGVPADRDDLGPHLTEGWPLSILEAAMFLKKRGILLAIASKNDPDTAHRIWNTLYGHLFPLSNFVNTKFSWEPKTRSISAILQETNLLPGNCLFVDDNPIEREQVKLAFPDMKLISGPIYTWRRTLLWATELQVPYITTESIGRTESIQSVIQREAIRTQLSEEDYLRDLRVTLRIDRVDSIEHNKFKRSFELLNKTNQFNTTGRRWSEQELAEYLADGGSLLSADVSDRLSDYGLTAVMLHRDGECTQLVMSCRVFGLRVEFAIFNEFLKLEENGVTVLFRDTGKNALCRKFLEKIGLPTPQEQVTGDAIDLHIPTDHRLPEELTNPVSVNKGSSLQPALG